MTLAFRCVCGHTPFAHIEYVGNCRECPMTVSEFRLPRGKYLAEPHCVKYRDQSFMKRRKPNKLAFVKYYKVA